MKEYYTGIKKNGTPQKIDRRITILPSNSTSGYMPKRIENRDLNRYLYTHVYSGIIKIAKR